MSAGKRKTKEVIVLSDSDDEPPKLRSKLSSAGRLLAQSVEQSSPIVLSDDDDPLEEHSGGAASSSSAVLAYGEERASEWHRPSTDEITCPICLCDTPSAEAVRLRACSHAFCEDCIGTFVRAKVAEGEVRVVLA